MVECKNPRDFKLLTWYCSDGGSDCDSDDGSDGGSSDGGNNGGTAIVVVIELIGFILGNTCLRS